MLRSANSLSSQIANTNPILVIRLGHLGDLLLTLPALLRQKCRSPERELIVITRRPLVPLLQRSPLFQHVLAWEDVSAPGPCWVLARRLRPVQVWDLQGSLRTRLWTGLLKLAYPRVYVRRPTRDFLFRRAQLRQGWPGVLARWLRSRRSFPQRAARQQWERVLDLRSVWEDDASPPAEVVFGAHPWRGLNPASDRLPEWTEQTRASPPAVQEIRVGTALLPGARHATKCWPIRHWVKLAQALVESGERVWVLGGPGDARLLEAFAADCPELLLKTADASELLSILATCRCAIGQDSGLSHLAESVGTPVLMLLGPTVAAFGFAPSLPGSRIAERVLPCRPCTLHGGRRCPLDHHACLEGLDPARVLALWRHMLGPAVSTADGPVRTSPQSSAVSLPRLGPGLQARRLAVFMLYRQRFPAAAPQSVQWLSTSHALARAGAEVTMLADPPRVATGGPLDVVGLLSDYGLSPAPGLSLGWLSLPGRSLRGLEYRTRLLAYWIAKSGVVPVFFSRSLHYSAQWLRLNRALGLPGLLVHEWHYSSLANAQEAGRLHEETALMWLESEVAAGADGHVTVAEGMAAFLKERYRLPGDPFVVPNGGPPVGLTRERLLGPPRVVYAGLFRRPSDLSLVLEVATQLPAGVELWILGGDEEGHRLREVRAQAERLGLDRRIVFTGALSPAQARDIVASATLALATFSESINLHLFACPLKILEYQALGVPLVASDFPTVRALVTSGVDGLLATGPELPQAVLRLLEDEPLRHHLRAGGLKAAASRTWEQRGVRLYEVLCALREKGEGASSGANSRARSAIPAGKPCR